MASKVLPPSASVEELETVHTLEEVRLQMPEGFRNGAIQVEVVKGGFISPAKVY